MTQGVFTIQELNGYITANSSNISLATAALGLSSQHALAVAMSIGREINNKSYDLIWKIKFDIYGKQPVSFVGQDGIIRSELSTLPVDGPADPRIYLSMRDVGPGKIQVRTAVNLLNDYLSAYPDDPLQLGQFQSDYGGLASQLANWSSDVSSKMGSLMVWAGEEFFHNNVPSWSSWNEQEKSAALVSYYSRGEARLSSLLNDPGPCLSR